MPAPAKTGNYSLLIFVFSFTTYFALPLSAQNSGSPSKDTLQLNEEDSKVFEKVEVEASFPGGETAWRRFLEQNLNAAVLANKRAPAGTYTVVVQFVVDKEGKVSDITPLTEHGYGMEEEVVRILRKAPRWKPAVQEGRTVKAYRKQPVTFVVMEEEKKKRKNKD